MTIEADPRHVEIVVMDTCTKDAKTLSSTGEKSEGEENIDVEDESEGGCWIRSGRRLTGQALQE